MLAFLREVARVYPVCSFWGTKRAARFGAAIDLGTVFTPIFSGQNGQSFVIYLRRLHRWRLNN